MHGRIVLFLSVIFLIYAVTLSIFLPKAIEKNALEARAKLENEKTKLASVRVATVGSENERLLFIPTNTPTPTRTPTPTPIPKPTSTPASSASGGGGQASIDEIQAHIMKAINEYRASQGLSHVSADSQTCNFAKERAGELASNFSHDGFSPYPYPSYSKVTENIAMNSDYKKVVPAWIASSGHAENMRADTPYVCVAKNGNYYAYEGWRP